jgi:pyruvate kinase
MPIRTKIVATVGPACARADVLRKLVEAGADLFRINFSHGQPAEWQAALDVIRQVEREAARPIGVLGDLCGPKIRVGAMADAGAPLQDGQRLTVMRHPIVGDAARISTTLPELADRVRPGQILLLDDGRLRLEVVEAGDPEQWICRVLRGGWLSGGKGVNLPHTDLDLPALTEKDLADLRWLAARDFDYVAQSFVCRPEDIEDLRARLTAAGRAVPIVAKIEKPQAMARIADIVAAADAVMVARGDLGVEMDLPAVPVAQKTIARECARQAKPCIIATQMLESMTQHAAPTRAEVSDVANAVLDHADAVMLSGETAVGRFPVEAVSMMNETVGAIQEYHDHTMPARAEEAPRSAPPVIAALAQAIRAMVERQAVQAVAVYTLSGRTAQILSKYRLACPVAGLSPEPDAVRRMTLHYGVQSLPSPLAHDADELLAAASRVCRQLGLAGNGDRVAVVFGQPFGVAGLTNSLVLHTLEAERGDEP